MEQVLEQDNELLSFKWDTVEEEQPTVEEPKEEPKEEKKEEVKEEKPEFTFDTSKTEDGEEIVKKENNEPVDSIYNDLFKDLKENNIFNHVELEEGEELTAERFFQLQEEEYEAEVSERINNWAKNIDEDGRKYLKFLSDGGKTKDFLEVFVNTEEPLEGDINDEEYQDDLIREKKLSEGFSRDETEEYLSNLPKTVKRKEATLYKENIQETVEKRKKQLLEEQERAKQRQAEELQQFNDNIKGVLENQKEVGGFKITEKDKTNIYNFLTRRDQKVNDKVVVTGFQKKLAEVFKDTNKLVVLAKLLHNDFDLSQIEKQIITKETKKIKSNLENRKTISSSSGSSYKEKQFYDLF